MPSTRQRGAYYLRKTIDHFKKEGWRVEKLEVNIPFFIKGKVLFSRKDLLGADAFIWNNKECFLVQVKAVGELVKDGVSKARSQAKAGYSEWNVPLPKLIVIWLPKKKPIIERLND